MTMHHVLERTGPPQGGSHGVVVLGKLNSLSSITDDDPRGALRWLDLFTCMRWAVSSISNDPAWTLFQIWPPRLKLLCRPNCRQSIEGVP